MSTFQNISEYIKVINKKSKEAFQIISRSNSKDRNLAILNNLNIIEKNKDQILRANEIDIKNAKLKNLSKALVDLSLIHI